MSSQNWNNPSDPHQPYEPPAGQGGYQPPASPQQPGAYPPPGQPPYQPPAQQPYQPPAQQAYQPPAQQPNQAPGQQPYQAPGQPYPTQDAPGYASPYSQQVPQPYPGTPYPPVAPAGELASWGTRALGGLIDYVAPSIILSLIALPFAPNMQTGAGGSPFLYTLFNTILPLLWALFNSGWKQGTTGQTFGKQFAKTKLVSEATGQPLGVGLAIVRQVCHIVDTVMCFVGWLLPLWDAKRQTVADKIMKTVVIKAP